ncbi:MAG: hypothetical protein GDA42_07750 [Ekhidna sp.]|nr:hypothetical protein [Ekhidna sp.]
MGLTPHKDKLAAAINNPKAKADKSLLEEAFKQHYNPAYHSQIRGRIRI